MPIDSTTVVTLSQLQQKTTDEIIALLQALPLSVQELNLSENALYIRGARGVYKIFQAIPCCVKTINLSYNTLGKMPNLHQALKGLSHLKLSSLSLASNRLCDQSGRDLRQIFKALSTLHTLDVSKNMLFTLSINSLYSACFGFPQQIKHINVSDNQLSAQQGENFIEVFKCFNWFAGSLDLSHNQLLIRTGDMLAKAFFHLSDQTHQLDLSHNYLSSLPPGALEKGLRALKPSIKKVNLSHNGLNHIGATGLIAMMNSLPSTVNQLDLRYNELGTMHDDAIASWLQAIPPSIEHLALADNQWLSGGRTAATCMKLLPLRLRPPGCGVGSSLQFFGPALSLDVEPMIPVIALTSASSLNLSEADADAWEASLVL